MQQQQHQRVILKGLSLAEPWATLVALGHKTVDTRSWRSHYRGLLLIHASNKIDREFEQRPAISRLIGNPRYDFGHILAVCELVNCISTNVYKPNPKELIMGDYSEGRYAWILQNIQTLPTPIPYKGSLSVWPVRDEVAEEIERQGILLPGNPTINSQPSLLL